MLNVEILRLSKLEQKWQEISWQEDAAYVDMSLNTYKE